MEREARYVTIERWLETQCERLGPGAQLPTEAEVAERFGVSRMTARKAYEGLVAEGRIERRRGAGTVILPPRLRREEATLRSFSDEVRRRGMTPSSRIVHTEVAPAPDLAARLGLTPDAWVVHVERVRLADGVPLALESSVLPADLAPVLDADLEQGSLHAAITALGHVPLRAQGHVCARLADERENALLDLTSPSALLVEIRTIVDGGGRALEATQTVYVGSRWVMGTGSFVAPTG